MGRITDTSQRERTMWFGTIPCRLFKFDTIYELVHSCSIITMIAKQQQNKVLADTQTVQSLPVFLWVLFVGLFVGFVFVGF